MTESFAQRLARLRREGPQAAAPSESAESKPRAEALKSSGPKAESLAKPPVRLGLGERERELLGRRLEPVATGHERTLGAPERLVPFAPDVSIRTDRRDVGETHGAGRFEQALGVSSASLARLGLDPALEHLDLARAVYLDIETTGLSGGAGTYPFLVALGGFEGGSFCVSQLFLESPAGEPEMLREVARRIAASSGLVSFFGKSFDRHRLEDKMRQHGVAPPFARLPHLDLYHPCRRLYGRSFGNGRLQTLERYLLGFERENDLSGAFAPAAWFDFLAGRPHLLEAVFHHNLLDVFSLALLAAHVGDAEREHNQDGQPLPGPPLRRAMGLASIAARRRDRGTQAVWLERALERCEGEADEPTRRMLALELASVRRQLGEVELALEAWRNLARGHDRIAALARLEEGKLLTRRAVTRPEGLDALREARGRVLHVLSEPERSRVLSDLDGRLMRWANPS